MEKQVLVKGEDYEIFRKFFAGAVRYPGAYEYSKPPHDYADFVERAMKTFVYYEISNPEARLYTYLKLAPLLPAVITKVICTTYEQLSDIIYGKDENPTDLLNRASLIHDMIERFIKVKVIEECLVDQMENEDIILKITL